MNKIRFSRQFPKLLVSCGDEKDIKLKLWNVGQKQDDEKAVPLHTQETIQIKHKAMAQSTE